MYRLYLDASTIVDACWEYEPRHSDAKRLFEICNKHFGDIEVVVSSWSRSEAQGVIYGKLITSEKHIKRELKYPGKDAGKDPRTYFPPFKDLLIRADKIVSTKFDELRSLCKFKEISLLSDSESDADVLGFAQKLASVTGIFPPDSLHLALAINELVDFFVATDGDLLDRIVWHEHYKYIQELLDDRAYPNKPPAFEAVPLRIVKKQRITPPAASIFDKLVRLGFS